MSDLSNKTVVITGGSSGIGLATAVRLHAQGAQVVLFGRNAQALAQAKTSLGERVVTVQGDVTVDTDLQRLFSTTKEHFGSVDILVVNAGIARVAALEDVSPMLFDEVFDINVKGAYFTVQHASPLLREGGSVVLITSSASSQGQAGMSIYAATKAALRSLARSLAAELLPRGIRVNAVSPGPIVTPIYGKLGLPQDAIEEFAAGVIAQVPMKRFGKANEVADAVAFLAGPGSTYVAGIDLAVDGGMTQM
jgi:NAD(P)-dependent dehydrogenase (short-subunit alcohol dehydrogenase family)